MNLSNELLYQIAIKQIPNVGNVTAKILISYCGGVQNVFKQSKSKLLKIPGIGETTASSIAGFKDFIRAENELIFIEKNNIKPIFYLDKDYPSRLKDIEDAPLLLFYKGNANLNAPKIVSVIGTRNATEYGKSFTDKLIEELKPTGAIILSGLAYGIDYQSHKAAINQGLPTVGVVAHGLDEIYPRDHSTIAQQMIENGGILSEYLSKTKADPTNFPTRNRIVAGMCDVLVVVETASRGGSMITVEIANSYNKDIMALPGRINDKYSQGCNNLIKGNKASMITKSSDLLALMNWDIETKNEKKSKQQILLLDLDEDDSKIINYIKQKTKIDIDGISFDLGFENGFLSYKLLDLEFKGLIRSLPGKIYEIA
jgi:DNA processing protein